MSITTVCPSCAAKFRAPDEAAGKTAPCPKCRSPLTVPVPKQPLATPKQKDYARELGIEFPDNIDRKAISNLIDDAVAKRDEVRFQRLDELEQREATAADGLRLADATAGEIVKALEARGLSAVIISMRRDDIEDFDQLKGIGVNISFTDNMTQHDMESVILTLAHPILQERLGRPL